MKAVLILLLLLSIGIVYAKDVNLGPGKSYEIDGKNITLIRHDSRNNNAIFCVNGIKHIIEEDKTRTINEVFIEVKRITKDSVEIDVKYKCKDCVCDQTCDNSICFDGDEEEQVEAPPEEPQQEITQQTQEPQETEQEETITPVKIGMQGIILAITIFIVVILGIIVLWKKY